jgi:hypothetical protein
MAIKRNRTLKRAAAREARKLMRGGMAAGLVALGACGESHAPGLDTSMANAGSHAAMSDGGSSDRDSRVVKDDVQGDAGKQPSNGSAGAAPDQPMSAQPPDAGGVTKPADASADAVDQMTLARNVLYSWTSRTQIMELRDSPVLLTRSEKSDGTQTQLSTMLVAMAQGGDALAKVLTTAPFQKGRYAWSNAWATVRGWPGESYGDQLLRIVLKPEAWIAVVRYGALRVIDLDDQEVAMDQALAHPERIAAVYYLNPGSDPASCGSFVAGCGTGAFREYFVNNESMVLEWSFGTQAILDELSRSIDVVLALREEIAANPIDPVACDFNGQMYCTWEGSYGLAPNSSRLEAYRHSMALASEYYLPTLENLDALTTALKTAFFSPDPFEHKP